MKLFEHFPELLAVISTKEDGSCRLRSASDPALDAAALVHRKAFAQKVGVEYGAIVSAGLVHGSSIAVVLKEDAGKTIEETDGILTQGSGVFLSITVADCLPVFLYDPKMRNIGLVHCGWRGLSESIIHLAIFKMTSELGSAPENIHAAIGPGIEVGYFEVKDNVLEKFADFGPEVFEKREGKTYLDLKKIATAQLIREGTPADNIEVSTECTHCLDSKYFSYRRDKPTVTETMMVIFGIKE